MELFRINCVTCQAELSVRNESIIGTIIACPRCGSMVEVAQPAAPETDTAAASVEAGSQVDSSLLALPAGSNFITWAMCVTAVGLTFIAGLTWWLTSSDEPEPVAVITETNSPVEISEQPTIGQIETEPESKIVEPDVDLGSEIQEPVKDPFAEEPITQSTSDSEPPLVADEVVEEPEEQPQDEQPIEEVEKVATVPRPPRHVFNALDLDPESMELGSLGKGDEKPQQPTIEVPPHPQHGNIVDHEVSTLPVARRGLGPEDGISTRNAQEQFELELPALEMHDMALARFLQLLSSIGGVPVSVSADQLLMAGISPRERVSLDARNVTLDSALAQVLKPLRLEHHYVGPHVIITRQAADKLREIDYPISDLVSSEAEGAGLKQWVEQLVAPDSWESATLEIIGNKLHVQQSQGVHYQLLAFLERLRMVRGMETRSRFPISRLAPTPLHAAMAPRLSRPALFTFTQETPLGDIVSYWQRELEVPFLVDWPALAEIELWPDTPVACAVADRNWQEALTAVLQPLGLDWRVCIGGGIEISALTEFRRDRQLELYPLATRQHDNGAKLLAHLRQHLSDTPSAQADSAQMELVYDSRGPALIALLNASAQRDALQWLIENELFSSR